MTYWIIYFVILITGGALGIGAILFATRQLKDTPRKLVQNMILVFLGLFLAVMAAEIFFKVFFAQTDGFSQTLAHRNWFERYWNSNSLGYRDVEWQPDNLHNKTKIVVLGDSFAAGYGIERIEDRFSNILGEKLGPDYQVMNIAIPAVSTQQEIENVKNFPYKPDILILQYYINDIRYAAEQRNAIFDLPKIDPPVFLKPLVENSYALNFFYWRTIRLGPQAWQDSYLSWLKGAYEDPDIWWLHQQELLTIYEGAASEDVRLIVVVFPGLTDIEGSRALTSKVVDLFEERGVPTLDVAELLGDNPPVEQLIVNPWDAHPSRWLHQRVADELYKQVVELERVSN